VEWAGCGLWDLIQPSFMFMVGVSLPYSLAARRAKGDGFNQLMLHTLWRSLLLVLLAVFLSSAWDKSTQWIFPNVLAQIGLGYPFLFAVAWLKPRWQLTTAFAVLLGYWALFALYPLPGANFDYAAVGVPADWHHQFTGFAAHWNKNSNAASAFDQWFLNLFPREKPFVYNAGGYATLNFVPSLATMIFGLLAGGLLRSEQPDKRKVQVLIECGIACLAVGWILDATGVCPVVKRIWTPAWAIFSTGFTLLFLAAFYFVIDVKGWRGWAFVGVVAGMNSIAMYVLANMAHPFVRDTLKIHLGQKVFDVFGPNFSHTLDRAAFLLVLWLVVFWMYRRKLFLKI
jgi:heparan-alpha-glucosaminide N-acetyltransferase